MRWPVLAFLAAFVFALSPVRVLAAPGDDDAPNILVRIHGNVDVGASETVGSVIVIDGDALIDGRLSHNLVVINGHAVVRGQVEGDMTVVRGTAELGPRAQIKNLNLVRSDLLRAPGATVSGHVNQRQNVVFRGAWLLFGALFWLSMTIAVVAAGLVFAAIGGRQLKGAAAALIERPVASIAGAVILCAGLPILAVVLVVTIVGLPLGLGLLLLALPILWLLGYVTVGTRVGAWISGALGRSPGEHPYLAAVVGLLIFQVLLLVPGLGAALLVLGAAWGAGGLGVLAWEAARGTPAAAASSPSTPANPPA